MKTTLEIDSKLMEEVVRLSGSGSEGAAIEAALTEYVRLKRKEELLAMRGVLDLREDWKALRESEIGESSDAR